VLARPRAQEGTVARAKVREGLAARAKGRVRSGNSHSWAHHRSNSQMDAWLLEVGEDAHEDRGEHPPNLQQQARGAIPSASGPGAPQPGPSSRHVRGPSLIVDVLEGSSLGSLTSPKSPNLWPFWRDGQGPPPKGAPNPQLSTAHNSTGAEGAAAGGWEPGGGAHLSRRQLSVAAGEDSG